MVCVDTESAAMATAKVGLQSGGMLQDVEGAGTLPTASYPRHREVACAACSATQITGRVGGAVRTRVV